MRDREPNGEVLGQVDRLVREVRQVQTGVPSGPYIGQGIVQPDAFLGQLVGTLVQEASSVRTTPDVDGLYGPGGQRDCFGQAYGRWILADRVPLDRLGILGLTVPRALGVREEPVGP